MAGYAIGDEVLDGWEVVRLIGQGGYGSVYEVRKELVPGSWARSALKVVSIPPSDSLVTSALVEGASREAVAAEYREVADSFMAEAGLLSSLSHSGIVDYQDHQRIAHPDGIGWDILLRMELLEPLTDLMATRPLDAGETVRMGAELADTLAFCHARGIVHRDVKPENVFADASGRYKLGDFGVSRTVEGTTGTLSRKGTEDYMAPELYYEQGYGALVDVYALGLVLYRLLNGNRLPFLPPAPQPVRYADRQSAQRRRLSGERFPLPAGCDPALFAVVERACAHDPEERPSAAELRDELREYGRSRGAAPRPVAGAHPVERVEPAPRPSPQPAEAASRTRNVWSAFGPQAAPTPAPEPKPAPKREPVPVRHADAPAPSREPAVEAGPGPNAEAPEPAVPGRATPDAAAPPVARPKAKGIAAIVALAVVVVIILGISVSQGAWQPRESTSAEGAAHSSPIGDAIDFPLDLAAIDPDSSTDMADLSSALQGFYEWKHETSYESGEYGFEFFASEEMFRAFFDCVGMDNSAPWELELIDEAEEDGYDRVHSRSLSREDIASGDYTVTNAEFTRLLSHESFTYEELAGYVAEAFGYEKVAIWDDGYSVRGTAIKGDVVAYILVNEPGYVPHQELAYYLHISIDYKTDAHALGVFDEEYSSDSWAEKHPDIYRASREG